MVDIVATRTVAVIGGGPAGLMAAEVLMNGGVRVHLYDRMPSLGRKLLMAGKGGLNITHAEPLERFLSRYGARRERLQPIVESFGPAALREWVKGLGVETFVGTSQRVFPHEMKAAPLLRAWLHRLREGGVDIHVRHGWTGWNERGALTFTTPQGVHTQSPDAVVLAAGGGSWPQLGSDATWVRLLGARGVPVAPLRPANCGFDVAWSDHFRRRFSGVPVKPVVAACTDAQGVEHRVKGEFTITSDGVEGGLIYALSAPLRDAIERLGIATLTLDLAPARDVDWLTSELSHPRGRRSLSSHIESRVGLKGVKRGLLREVLSADRFADPRQLAAATKALPLTLLQPRPLEEAISTAGGVPLEALDASLMIRSLPGVFCAGEMLDWEAPTGGYLLTACLATGRAAGSGALQWVRGRTRATY
ncbi:MAG TPA: TIGR03862 family flavoprotein [Burkholderiales bacterium]|nr:TIGR03862 family flavoprotein [Burkholderiales bacterium]